MNDELVERQAAYNLHFLPLPGRANDRETQMARLQDYMIADRDEDAAKRVRDYYGEGVPVGAVSEKAMQYFVGAAMARNLGISGAPEAYWLGREKPEALPEVEQQDDLYTEMGRDLITKTQDAWVKQQVKLQERRQTLGTVLQQIVQEGEANKKESAAWLGFLDAQGRGVWSEDEAVSLVKATEAFSMMRGLMDDPQSAGANVLTKGSTGQLIFDALYGDEMATGLFFSALQDRIADMKTAEEERNALVQFAHAFEAATKNLTAGMMGGHFRAFVTDEQVDEFNANRARHEAFQAVLQGAAGADYEASGGLSVMEDMRLQELAHAARESGQLNADGSVRKMTDEERRSTQELNEFRGQLHNAVQGVYDIDGLAKFGKMMPGSLAYLVPGGMLASAMSMRTHDLASQLGEGSDWVSANARATVNAAIQAGVEKMAFGSIKATKMAPGLDALMSTGPMARVFGKLYGTTAGRIGMGVVAGGLEETFAEPAAGLLLSGIYNAFAPTGLELDSPWVAYKNEMAEMLKPDQVLATSLYGLLLGGVNVPGHRAAAKHYRKVVEGLESIGIDHNVAANMARSDGSLQQIAAGVQQVDAALKKDAGGVFGYIAELYPQLQEISTFENLMRAYNLPKMLPGEGGNVRVQYKDEDGKVQELVMSQEAGRLFVQARIEQLGSKVQVGFADMVLGQVMTGKVAEKSDSWVVSVEDADMNADYFRRIAAAAGIRLSQGAKATDIAPEIHPYIPLGTLAQQGRAWESRMKVARGEAEEKLGRKLTDEEWAQREKLLVSRVNRVRVASQDGRVRTVLRVARGGYGAMEVLEDVTEDFLSLDMEENGRELGWYADNLLELERALGRQGAFLHELKEGESYDRMAIIEGVGKLVQSKVLADTTRKYKLSEKLNAFLDMIRHLVQRAVAMLKLGKAINKVLADKEASAKLDPEFARMVDRLVEKDVEFLRELQLEDGLAAMQRVLEQRVPSTPVLAEAEAKHGEQVREAAAAKAAAQRAVDADVAAAEAALEGDEDGSMSVHIPADRVCHNRKEARLLVGLKGAPIKLENKFLEIEAVFNAKSDGKFNDRESIGRTFKALDDTGLSEEEIKSAHYTAFGNVAELFANAERMKFERAYKKQNERKGFLQIFSPFEVEGWKDSFMARIELELHQEKGHLPTAYLLNVSIEKQPLFLGRRGAGAELFDRTEADHIRADFPEVVKRENAEQDGKPGAADASMSVTDAQETGLFAGGVLEASNAVVTEPSFSIEALHATPHRFRKFDTSKMGSGEGNQAFGWGLYFSGGMGSNEFYYNKFNRRTVYFKKNEEISHVQFLKEITEAMKKHGGWTLDLAFSSNTFVGLSNGRSLKQLLAAAKRRKNISAESLTQYKDALDELSVRGLEAVNGGNAANLRVELNADDSNLLMWDEKVPAELHDAVRELKSGQPARGLVMQMPEASKECWEGYRIYSELTIVLGTPKAASEWLAERGYKGIKYLDGMSRRAGEGTYNYVIFSGDDVKITGVNETGRYDAPWEDYEDETASFSVVGEGAANWDKIKHRAFKGRDDGKLRVELDASQAMFRSPSYRERVDEIKAFIEEQRELAVEDGRQRQYAELEARLDRLDEAMDSASEDEVSEILREYERIENERKDFRRKLYGEWRAVFPEIEMEEGDYLLLERAILGEKGASRTNNAVFMLASMRDNLGITPVERALHPKLETDRESIVAALKRLKESEVAQELKAVYDRTEAGERTEEMRARVEQLADDVRQEAVRLGVPERILRGKPWFRVHMELFERDAEDVADAALRTVLLEDVLDFPELYEAYPQLRDYRVYGDMLGSTANRGMYDGWNAIVLNDMLGEQEVLGTLLHEVQHAIQKIEGFARGGNEDYANEEALLLASVYPEKYGWMLEKSPYELYRRLAGEVEARNVQKRLGYSAVEREMLPFNSTMDIPEYETLVSFSVFSPSEASGLRALQSAVRGKQDAVFRSDTLNADVMLPFGSAGVYKNPDNPKSKIVGAHGLLHIITARMAHGDSLEEATYTAVKAVLAAVNGRIVGDSSSENKKELTLDGYNTWVYLKWRAENKAWVVTGYKENDKHSSVDDRQRAMNLAESYALNTFGGLERVGAALEYSIARVAREYKQNNANPFLKLDFSSSMVDLSEEGIAHDIAAAGYGFRANREFAEQMMREIRASLVRMKNLGSKTRTDREDALAAMGGITHMVRALVQYLPRGYRFAVHPYMSRLEVLTELATTGNVEMLRENVSKGLQAWMDETSETWHEVLPQLSGNENMTREELTARVQEMMKEHAGQQLTEAVERIVERVAGQLRKHAKDTAVKRMRELLERVMPKKDPKSGKVKGGKMGADDYRDLEDVQAALDMNAEKLEAKMAALKAEMETPGLSEEKRDEKEALLMLYDQFGDPDSMSAEEAVAAYEALRQRIWMSRFEWENIQSEKRAARRAVVRRIVEGVGSVSENEYNAKKRRVKPTKRMKNLGDVLAGMPAAVGALRGYLPLREMADSLTRRANRAGELIKEWEAERWIALETLSKQTLGKSWRLSMDFMHKVLPTGVAFERPVYRTVDIKVPALRELLQMDAKARVAEMKRRREAGGKEAETALSERDIEAAAKELERMDEAGEVKGWVHTRYMKELRREENLQLSRGEALYAILMYEQPTYTERMEAQGYTPEVVAGLKKFIGDGMLEFGYGLRELFRIQGDKIAAIYEREFGVPFPREENYFAARWDVTEMKENPAEQLLAGMAGTPGAGNGWMKTRVNHELELDMTKDALQVFLQATTLTDTWMATQDIVADFKAWTRDKDFARALTALLGEESYTNLKDWIRILEQGGAQDCLNMGVTQDVINGLYGSGAVAILGLRVQTLIRQLPSVFNGLLGAPDITAGEWFATLARMKHGDAPMTFKRMKDSVLMKNRRQGRAGNMASQAVRSGDTDSSVTEEFLLASMLPMEWMDASCTAMSLVPVWNVYYDRAVRKGANHQEAEQAAWEQTTVVANLSSQPIGWLNKSKIAQSRNPIVKSMFYMLSENTAKFALCRALWRGGKKMAAFRAWLVYGAANAAISAMLDALQGDPEEWEKGNFWEYVFSALYGPLAGIPGVGEMLEGLVNSLLNMTGEAADIEWMKKMKTRASAGRALVDFQGSWKAMKRIYGFMTDNDEHSLAEYTRAAGTVSRTLAIGTGWMGNMVGYWSTVVAVLMNPIDFGARVWRNMRHYAEE